MYNGVIYASASEGNFSKIFYMEVVLVCAFRAKPVDCMFLSNGILKHAPPLHILQPIGILSLAFILSCDSFDVNIHTSSSVSTTYNLDRDVQDKVGWLSIGRRGGGRHRFRRMKRRRNCDRPEGNMSSVEGKDLRRADRLRRWRRKRSLCSCR